MLLHFLCSGCEYKESKMEKSAYCGLDAKIPGAGAVLEKNRPGAPGILYGFAFASSNGVISLPAGDFPSFGGLGVLPEVVTSVRGTGRPAGSRYLRSGDWASRRKLLPPLRGRPAGSCFLRLGGVPPEGIPLLGEGASRSGYFVFCEMPVMRLMTKSCCSSVTTLSQ